MEAMFRFALSRFAAVIALMLTAGSLVGAAQDAPKRGRKYKAPPPTARVEVTVLRDFNGKPIENAAVVFHPMENDKDKGGMELKTNEDGKAALDVLTLGDTVRLQIIAKGFQTYGGDYKIDQPAIAIEVKLKRPGEQYSIYKAHAAGADPNAGQANEQKSGAASDKGSSSDQKGSSSSDSSSSSSNDKPADSNSKPPAQSSPPQSN
jgi:5-hydroxyisourate hydrolase-like protein (transthyretin family)